MEKRVIFNFAESDFRKEFPLTRRVRIGEAICTRTLSESNSPLLMHGDFDPEDADPDTLPHMRVRQFDPFAQVVEPDPE